MKTKYSTASKKSAVALIAKAVRAGWQRTATTYSRSNDDHDVLTTYVQLEAFHVPGRHAMISIIFTRWADRRMHSQRVDARIESYHRFEPAMRRGLPEAEKAFEHIESYPRLAAKPHLDTAKHPDRT
jgi:hypothetical protein